MCVLLITDIKNSVSPARREHLVNLSQAKLLAPAESFANPYAPRFPFKLHILQSSSRRSTISIPVGNNDLWQLYLLTLGITVLVSEYQLESASCGNMRLITVITINTNHDATASYNLLVNETIISGRNCKTELFLTEYQGLLGYYRSPSVEG